MTTARDIIIDALREGGILALGETPEADASSEGLKRLNVIIRSLIGFEIGENLVPVAFGTNGVTTPEGIAIDQRDRILSSYLPSNTVLYVNQSSANTINLDPSPQDGARVSVIDSSGNFASNNFIIDANGRKIEGATSVTLNTNGAAVEWFYRADTGNWFKVTSLTENDTIPFPTEFEDLLSTMLAFRLNPRYGQESPGEMLASMARAKTMFKARYTQTTEMPAELALQRLKSNPNWDLSTFAFNRGRPWNY